MSHKNDPPHSAPPSSAATPAKPAPETSNAAIPDLKKKEKERKKAGLAWGGGAPGGAPFGGAAGAAAGGAAGGAARAAASAAASVSAAGVPGAVAETGGSFIAALLARLTATLFGKVALAGGAFLVVSGAGLYVVASRSPKVSQAVANLGEISSTIRPGKPGGERSLDYAAQSAKGELKFDGPNKPQETKPEPPAQVEKTEAPAATGGDFASETIQNLGDQLQQNRLEHNLSGAKLTSSLGASFGGKDIFSGPNAIKFGSMVDRGKLAALGQGPGKGASRGMAKATAARRVGETSRLDARSKRAMGQLKLARTLSRSAGAAGSGEATKTMAADAFDGGVTQGGEAPIGITDQPTTVNPMEGGGSAPDLTEPKTELGTDQTPYKAPLQNAMNMGNMAGQMKQMGMMMILIGTILLGVGIWLCTKGFPAAFAGIALILAGLMMIMSGVQMMGKAKDMGDKAKAMGDNIAKQYGQEAQGQIIKECVDQSLDGATMETCRPATQAPSFTSTIKEDVEKEGGSTYDLEGGAPIDGEAPSGGGAPQGGAAPSGGSGPSSAGPSSAVSAPAQAGAPVEAVAPAGSDAPTAPAGGPTPAEPAAPSAPSENGASKSDAAPKEPAAASGGATPAGAESTKPVVAPAQTGATESEGAPASSAPAASSPPAPTATGAPKVDGASTETGSQKTDGDPTKP